MFLEFAETKTEVGDLNEEQLSVVKPRKICHQFYSVISIKNAAFFSFLWRPGLFLTPKLRYIPVKCSLDKRSTRWFSWCWCLEHILSMGGQ